MRRDVSEQQAFSYAPQPTIPPRRSALGVPGATRHQPLHEQRIIRPGQEQRNTTSRRCPPAASHVAGHHAGLHPEDAPYLTGEGFDPEENCELDEPPRTRARTSAVRYPTTQGNQTRDLYTPPNVTRRLATRHISGVLLMWLGAGIVVMVLGWLVVSTLSTWWQTKQDDLTYGRPRTFQIDAVVGHGDDAAHPSHFIALNLNREVIVIELPGGDPSKAIIYTAGMLLGDGQDLTPITLSFENLPNGRPNMVFHIGDQEIVFTNNGQKFVPPAPH